MVEIRHYRKRPVVIRAVQFEYSVKGIELLKTFLNGNWFVTSSAKHPGAVPRITLKSLEGEVSGIAGDYVIKGVEGEFYICKKSIFEATYEDVEELC